MNLTQLENSVRSRVGNPSTTDVSNVQLDGHINNAYQEIFDKYKFRRRRGRAKFSTTIGTDKYEIDQLTDVVFKVWDRTNGRPLTYIGKTKLAQRDYDNTLYTLVQNGKPEWWTYNEQYIQLGPPPDGVYVIEMIYKVIFAALVSGSDTPVIPLPWHRGIAILASAIFYEDQKPDPVKSVYHRTAFDKWVSDKPVEEHEQTEAVDSGVQMPSLHGSSHFSPLRKPDGIWWDIFGDTF